MGHLSVIQEFSPSPRWAKLKISIKFSSSFSLQSDPAGGGALPGADGLPLRVLSEVWRKGHQGQTFQASSH